MNNNKSNSFSNQNGEYYFPDDFEFNENMYDNYEMQYPGYYYPTEFSYNYNYEMYTGYNDSCYVNDYNENQYMEYTPQQNIKILQQPNKSKISNTNHPLDKVKSNSKEIKIIKTCAKVTDSNNKEKTDKISTECKNDTKTDNTTKRTSKTNPKPETNVKQKRSKKHMHLFTITNILLEEPVNKPKQLKELASLQSSTKAKEHRLVKNRSSKRMTTIRKKLNKLLLEHNTTKISEIPQCEKPSFTLINPISPSVISQVHSTKFREYCNHFVTKEIDLLVKEALSKLNFFQKRSHDASKESKGKFKKRFVRGFHEILSNFSLPDNLKLIVIAPNIQNQKVLNDLVLDIIVKARAENIPVVFALTRCKLGQCFNQRISISAIGIINHNGVDEMIKQMLTLVEKEKETYLEKVATISSQLPQPSS